MTKILIFAVLLLVVWWIWRHGRSADSGNKPMLRPTEQMVQCVHCGVNQPIGESILSEGRYYCSADHLRDAHIKDR